MKWNGQTYKCPNCGLITGEQVGEEEVDYGILRHWCLKCSKNGPDVNVSYVGFRKNKKSKPVR